MKHLHKNIGLIIGILSLLVLNACKDNIDPINDALKFDRVFTPLELSAKITNQTVLTLDWEPVYGIDSYIVEISDDSLEFANIIYTETVAANKIPYVYDLPSGDTQYSVRVKSISAVDGVDDSKWSAVAFKSLPENIINNVEMTALGTINVKWEAGKAVTSLLFVSGAGQVAKDISAEEITAGEKTVSGLDNADYEIRLMNNDAVRGSENYLLEGDVLLANDADLSSAIGAAADGDVIVLSPGEYLTYTGIISLDKSITLRGLNFSDKPIIHIQLELGTGLAALKLKGIELEGNNSSLDYALRCVSADTYTGIIVEDCIIHNFNKSLISGGSNMVSITDLTMNNCVVTNILTNSADCIDFRGGYANITLTNSTFNNCAPARDFIRMDGAGLSGTGLTANILIDHCTLYSVSNNASKRLLYVRFLDNVLTVSNSIIAETLGYYTNQSNSAQPSCSMNNYFNANGFITADYATGAKMDISDNYTILDPVFTDAENGDFTISEQTLIDNEIGDPRWR